MLNVCLLGTGGTVPLPSRWLTSCLLRYQGHAILIDCGEGTQIALHKQKVSVKHLDVILLTHFHADHIAGLPGMLLTMAKSGRTEPILIVGPKDLESIMRGVMAIARYIPFTVQLHTLHTEEEVLTFGQMTITAFQLKHSVPTYGYACHLKRSAKFDVEKAKENNVPLAAWNRLQKGNDVEIDGITYTPSMVMGKERKGLKFLYATDTRPCLTLLKHAQDADLMIGEGMYGDVEKQENAIQHKHSTMYETAEIAKQANVKQLWLTHYSPSMAYPYEYKDAVKKVFEKTHLANDGDVVDLRFEEA